MNILATGPGAFVGPEPIFVFAPALWVSGILMVLVPLVIVLLGRRITAWDHNSTRSLAQSNEVLLGTRITWSLLSVAVIAVLYAVTLGVANLSAISIAEDQWKAEIAEWLGDEYGIKASEFAVGQMLGMWGSTKLVGDSMGTVRIVESLEGLAVIVDDKRLEPSTG